MAEEYKHVIQFTIEEVTGNGAGGGTGGGSGGDGGDGGDVTSPIVRTLQQLQEEFRNLSAQVRSVATSLEQIKGIGGATGETTGAPSGVSSVNPESINGLVTALEKMSESASEASSAVDEQSQASDDAAQASKDQAAAAALNAEMHERATRAAKERASAEDGLADANRRVSRGLKELQGNTPDRSPAGIGQGAGRLTDVKVFEDIIRGIGSNPDLRRLASKTGDQIAELVKIPAGANEDVTREAKALRKAIGSVVRDSIDDIRSGKATSSSISKAGTQIRQLASESKANFPAGAAPSVDSTAITRALGAKALAAGIDRVNADLENLGKSIEDGTDALSLAAMKDASLELVAILVRLTNGVSSNVLAEDSSGRDKVTDGINTLRQLRGEGVALPPEQRFNPIQLKAFNTLQDSLKSATEPLEIVRRITKDLVSDGAGLPAARTNLDGFINSIKGMDTSLFPDTQTFLEFEQALKNLRKVKVGQQGQLTGPAGTIDRDSAILSNQRAVQQARASLAARSANREPGQTGRLAPESIDLQVPTNTGGIRKLRVELEATGDTLDSVRVKAKDLGDNMFDRTSVRAALQRVAVWSAAAGLVFGAFTALKTGLSVMIETESALVGLSKVMNESSVDLQGFKNEAQEAAIAISKDFGQPLEQVLETMILFGQQGKNLRDTIQLSKAAALASSVTTLDQPEAASALTAATQQFGLAFSEAESIVDKFNEVANNAAVTETDLAQALKKSGQAAKNAGLDLDDFNGVVAAIAEQTRQSGNEIGTALRFIFSRLQTPEAEKGLAQVGISARDAAGNIKGFTPIIEELAGKFDNLSNSQKTQVAISIAGTRRFNTLLALLDNFSRFQDSAASSANSAGSAFREQQKVTETAAFKIEQLKNSLKELALSFGDSLLNPLKLVVDTLGTLVGILSSIPGPIKTLGAGIGIGSLAFLKFSDHITDFLGLAGSVKDASGVIGGSLRTNITQGLSRESQISKFGADTVQTASFGVTAARSAPDLGKIFGKGATGATEFSKQIAKANTQLIIQNGVVAANAGAFGKFGSTIRGFSLESSKGLGTTALALNGLNSGLVRFAAFLGIIANKIVTSIPIVSGAFTLLDAQAAKTGSTILASLGTVLRFAVAGAVIYGAVKGFQALKDAAYESAEEVEDGLASEIQKRKEAVAALGEQENKINSLSNARRRAASVSSPAAFEGLTPSQTQDSLAGRFKSTAVALSKLRKQEQEAANSVGFSNPELIDSIDEFGNVVLNSADSFDVLAQAAGNAQKVLLGLAQVKVVGGFNDDLKETEGTFKKVAKFATTFIDKTLTNFGLGSLIPDDIFQTPKETFDKDLASFRKEIDSPVVKDAKRLGVSVSSLDPDKAVSLKEKGSKFQRSSLNIRRVVTSANERIKAITPDSGRLVFEALAADAQQVFAAEIKILSSQGIDSSVEALLNKAFLQNRSVLKEIREQISSIPEITIGNLRESGNVFESLNIKKDFSNVQEEVNRLSGGELIIFKDVRGFTQQAVVDVTATGKRQIQGITDKLGTIATLELTSELSKSSGEIKFFDPDKIKKQFTIALQEIGRVVAGAGRGGLLGKDLDLGVNFRSELSGQQRAAQGDELLFTDLQQAQAGLAAFRESFGADAKEGKESTSKITDPEQVASIKKMARAIDELSTAAKLAVEIEKVSIAFEKAAESIKNSRINDAFDAAFSGALGATTGALKRAFDTPVLRKDLDPVAVSDKQSQGVVELANELTRTQEANGKLLAGLQVAERNINTFVRDFQTAGLGGGSADPNRLSDLARRSAALSDTGLDKAQAIQTTISAEHLTATEKTNEILEHIRANLLNEPRLIGAALAQSALSARGNDSDLEAVAAAVEANASQVPAFTSQDFRTIISTIPAKLIPSIVGSFRESQAPGAASKLTTDLLSAANVGQNEGTGDTRTSVGTIPTEARDRTRSAVSSAITAAFTDEQFSKIADSDRAGEVQLDPAKIKDVLNVTIKTLSDSGNATAQGAADKLSAILEKGGANQDRIFALVESSILSTVNIGTPQKEPEEKVSKSLEQTKIETENLAAAMAATTEANDAALQPLREIVGSFFSLKDAIVEVSGSLRKASQQILDDVTIGRDLSQFSGPQGGLLSGVTTPSNALDSRRNISDLSGAELTSLESPQLSTGLSDVGTIFDALVGQLSNVKQIQLDAQRDLEGFQAEGNVKGISLAKEALSQLGGVSNLVEGQLNSAQGTLKTFGESFRDIEAVNQLRVDVEKLVQSFDKEISLKFDRTSIQTALGNTLFSATRPTFEQFSQGQSGFLTKFERSLASIDFQEQSGAITSQEADVKRDETEFTRNEDIIALAQDSENQKLQAAVSSAEQVRSRLFDFVQSGAPGTEAAQALLNQITTELESAGDIIPGGSGRSTIRDPRTGQDVDVPASAVNTFQGLPGLSNITQQLTQLSQDATASTAQQNADLITQPLLLVLDQIPTKLDSVVEALKDASGLDNPEEARDLISGSTDVTTELPRLLAIFKKEGTLSASDAGGIVSALGALTSSLSPNTLAGVLQTTPVVPTAGSDAVSFGTFLTENLPSRIASSKDVDQGNVTAGINSLLEKANESQVARFELLAAPLSEAAASAALTTTSLGDMSKELSDATEAVSKFSASLTGVGPFSKGDGDASKFLGAVQKRAQGGLITGPGGPTEDKVPLLASPGEFVINAKAASSIGLDNLNKLNSTTGSIGPDKDSKGATLRFAEGGEVPTSSAGGSYFRAQEERLRVNRQEVAEEAAKKKEEEDATPARLRKKLRELEERRQYFLTKEPPSPRAVHFVQEEIAKTQERLAKVEQKYSADKARLQELRDKGVKRQEYKIDESGQIDLNSRFQISDDVIGVKSREELIHEELVKRDELANRQYVFPAVDPGGTSQFARINENGTYAFDKDVSKGGVDTRGLRGVSTRDPKEFHSEVARRKEFNIRLANAETDKQEARESIQAEFIELEKREEREKFIDRRDGNSPLTEEESARFEAAKIVLLKTIATRTRAQFGTYPDRISTAFNAAKTLNEGAEGKRTLERPDYFTLADQLSGTFPQDLRVDTLRLSETTLGPLAVREPPSRQLSPQEEAVRTKEDSFTTNLGYNPERESYNPTSYGSIFYPFPELESAFADAKGAGVQDGVLSDYIKQAKEGTTFRSAVSKRNPFTRAAKHIANTVADADDDGFLINGLLNVASTGLNIAGGVVEGGVGIAGGNAFDLATNTDISDIDAAGSRAFFNAIGGAADTADTVGGFRESWGESSDDIARIERLIANAGPLTDVRSLRQELSQAKLGRNTQAAGAALLAVGGGKVLRSKFKSSRSRAASRKYEGLLDGQVDDLANSSFESGKITKNKDNSASRAYFKESRKLQAESKKRATTDLKKRNLEASQHQKVISDRKKFDAKQLAIQSAKDIADANKRASETLARSEAQTSAVQRNSYAEKLQDETFRREGRGGGGTFKEAPTIRERFGEAREGFSTFKERVGQGLGAAKNSFDRFRDSDADLDLELGDSLAPAKNLSGAERRANAKASKRAASADNLQLGGGRFDVPDGPSTITTPGIDIGPIAGPSFVDKIPGGRVITDTLGRAGSRISDFLGKERGRNGTTIGGAIKDVDPFALLEGVPGLRDLRTTRYLKTFLGAPGLKQAAARRAIALGGPAAFVGAPILSGVGAGVGAIAGLPGVAGGILSAGKGLLSGLKGFGATAIDSARGFATGLSARGKTGSGSAGGGSAPVAPKPKSLATKLSERNDPFTGPGSFAAKDNPLRNLRGPDQHPGQLAIDSRFGKGAANLIQEQGGLRPEVLKAIQDGRLSPAAAAHINDSIAIQRLKNNNGGDVSSQIASRMNRAGLNSPKIDTSGPNVLVDGPPINPPRPAAVAPPVTPADLPLGIDRRGAPIAAVGPNNFGIRAGRGNRPGDGPLVLKPRKDSIPPTPGVIDKLIDATGANQVRGGLPNPRILLDVAKVLGSAAKDKFKDSFGKKGLPTTPAPLPLAKSLPPRAFKSSRNPVQLHPDQLAIDGAFGVGATARIEALGGLTPDTLARLRKGALTPGDISHIGDTLAIEKLRASNEGNVAGHIQGRLKEKGVDAKLLDPKPTPLIERSFPVNEDAIPIKVVKSVPRPPDLVNRPKTINPAGPGSALERRLANRIALAKADNDALISRNAAPSVPQGIKGFRESQDFAVNNKQVAQQAKGAKALARINATELPPPTNKTELFPTINKTELFPTINKTQIASNSSSSRGKFSPLSPEEIEAFFSSSSAFPKFATGGKVTGPGGPKSDRVPILASPGEFVINADAVGKIGLPTIESMNRTGTLPKFRDGGLIGGDGSKGPDLFDILSGRSGGIDVGAALQVLGDSRTQHLFVNNRTGEEVLAASSLESELAEKGFKLSPVSADLELIDALTSGKKVFTNNRTGDSVIASQFSAGELKSKGYLPDDSPLSQLLEGSLLQNKDGSLTLLAPGDTGIAPTRSNDELAALRATALKEQRSANARFSENADATLLSLQGRTSFSTALPGSTGRGARLQDSLEEEDFEGFGNGGSIRRKRFGSGGLLSGPGGPKSDDIPILASNGEFILNAEAAGKLGLPILEELNTTGRIPGFMDGGDVSGRTSGSSVGINTEEIANAIKNAFAQAASEASITVDAEAAASSVSSALSTALANIQFPAVKLDSSSLQAANLGNSVGSAIRDRLEAAEGTLTGLKADSNNILDGLVELDNLKTSVAGQEDRILDKVRFELNKEKSIDSSGVNSSTVVVDKEIRAIRIEMIRIEGDLKQTTAQAALALSKAQAK